MSVMRVTNTMLKNNYLTNLEFTVERLYEAENVVLTEKRVNTPSDDPIDALNALVLRERISEIKQYQRNINRAGTQLQNTETVIEEIVDMFERVRELAVQGASDNYSQTDKISLSYEIDQILEQLVIDANHQADTTYTFGGTYNNIPPYVAVRNDDGEIIQVTTSGSSGDIMQVLGDSVEIKTNVNGEELFEEGVNLFELLIDLRDDMRENDTDGISNGLSLVDDASEKIYNIQSVIGSKVNRVESAGSRAESDLINFTEYLSNTEDADATQAVIDYQTQLLLLQTSFQAGSMLFQYNLVDFLR